MMEEQEIHLEMVADFEDVLEMEERETHLSKGVAVDV